MNLKEQIKIAKSLEEISSIIADCKRCDLYQTKTKDVPGVGSPKAEIMFIGEAPGKKEDMEGEPFVGAAGKFLTEMIEGIGLKRSDVYIANVLKHRPPGNRDPFPEEAKACFPYLERQIELIQPKLIVFLGRHAMNRFFPEFRISNVHGKAFQEKSELRETGLRLRSSTDLSRSLSKEGRSDSRRKQAYLALYHPAAALYNGGMRETLKKDFNKIPGILAKLSETKEDDGDNAGNNNFQQESLF